MQGTGARAAEDDTRRKTLAGVAVLDEAEQRPDKAALLKLLDRFLTRPDDRALPADLETEMAEEDGSEMAGPARAPQEDRQPYSF
jgi:hypothetical protein